VNPTYPGVAAISTPPPIQPFASRASALGWGGACLAASIVFQIVMPDGGAPASGTASVLAAISMSTLFISAIVCWVISISLGLRAHSRFWVVLAILLIPPFNAFTLAFYAPLDEGKETKR
jgi:hypothetical protein